jgi:hypothetical protein
VIVWARKPAVLAERVIKEMIARALLFIGDIEVIIQILVRYDTACLCGGSWNQPDSEIPGSFAKPGRSSFPGYCTI